MFSTKNQAVTQAREGTGVFVLPSYMRRFKNPTTAILLSQLNYWYKPDNLGRPKLKVMKNGMFWLAKSAPDFEQECGLSKKQVCTAIKILIDAGIIEVAVFKFNGTPTRHIRVLQAKGGDVLHTSIEVPPEISIVPLGIMESADRNLPKCLEELSLTEITAETTSETTLAEPKINTQEQKQNQAKENVTITGCEKKQRNPLRNDFANDVLTSHHADKGKPEKPNKETISGQVYEVWRYEVPRHTSLKFITPFTGKQCGQAKMLVGKLGNRWEKVLRYTLQDWIGFTQYVQTKAGVKLLPQQQNMDFMLKYAAEAMNKYISSTAPKYQPPVKSSVSNCTTASVEEDGKLPIAVKPKEEEGIVTLTYLDVQKMLEDEDEDEDEDEKI